MDIRLTVVIPTYNREWVLEKCLNALCAQTLDKQAFDAIVVDDGSAWGTSETVDRLRERWDGRLLYLRQENKGPAAARNAGVKRASGGIVLFLGDDIIAEPSLLEKHVLWHEQYPSENVAVLGHVTWSRDVRVSPFMRWLEDGGPQFAFRTIEGTEASFHHFYTCNVSLKREFFMKAGGFDERFPYAAYEDIEFGYRCAKMGMVLRYNREATAYHCHPDITRKRFMKRMELVGESEWLFHSIHPEVPLAYDAFKALLGHKRPSGAWAFLYEALHRVGIMRLISHMAWQAHRLYSREVAENMVKGYEKRSAR